MKRCAIISAVGGAKVGCAAFQKWAGAAFRGFFLTWLSKNRGFLLLYSGSPVEIPGLAETWGALKKRL